MPALPPESAARPRVATARPLRFAIEETFVRWGNWVAGNARTVIVTALALTAVLGSGLADLRLDTTSRGFLHDDDPIQRVYEAYRAEFGRDVDILVVLEPRGGFSLAFLETLSTLHDAISREVPQLESVTSFANARAIHAPATAPGSMAGQNEAKPASAESEEDWLAELQDSAWVGTLQDRWPLREADVRGFVRELSEDPLYRNRLITDDGALTTIVIKTQPYTAGGSAEELSSGTPRTDFITGEEDAAIVAAIESVVSRFESPELAVHVVGAPAFAVELQQSMRGDIVIFTSLALVTIALLLFALFRRPAGVVLPLVVVSLSVVATLGTMGLLGTPIRVPTQVLPSFLLAVGVCGSVHLLVLFLRHYDHDVEPHEAVAEALGHAGLAILLTGLTTAAGLFSFFSAEIAPIGEFGWYGAFGVLVALIYTLGLLPAVLAAFPPKRRISRNAATKGTITDRFLLTLGRTATEHPWTVVVGTVLLLVVGASGIARISVSHDPLLWLPASSNTRQSAALVDEAFHGIMSLEILVHTDREKGLLQPELLQRIDGLEQRLRRLEVGGSRVGQVISAVDTLKIWRSANDPDASPLPAGREALLKDLVRFRTAGGDEMSGWINDKRSTARISVRVPWMDAVHYPALIEAVEREVEASLAGIARYEVTGGTAVMSQTIDAVINSLIRSYLIALALIVPLMVFMIGSLRQGLISMVPNLAPIGLTLGLMGWVGIPMDVFTLLVGCIAIGLAVDNTIHFMHVFRSEYLRVWSVERAVNATLRTTGRALLFASMVLATGFSLYIASSMETLRHFGGLIALAIALAMFANVFLAPALLKLYFGSSRKSVVTARSKDGRTAEPMEAAIKERLEQSAALQDCDPLWLRRGLMPVFDSYDVGERGPRLILLHGLFGAMSNWDQTLPVLAKFSRVSALSLPLFNGHRSEITVQSLAVYVEAYLRCRGIEDAVLCGNSMGGHVALRVALHAPDLVGGLVLTGSSGLYEHEPSTMPLRPDEGFVREQMHRVFYSKRWVTDEGVEEMTELFGKKRDFLTIIKAARSAKRDNLEPVLSRIAAPTLLLWGEEDQITPLNVAQTFEDLMPNAKLVTTPRCGHAPMIEAAHAFAAEVERFLLRLTPQGI